MKNIFLIVLCVILIGCATPRQYQSHMDLHFGMPKQQVLAVLGPPSERQVYKKSDETIVEYLIYNNFESYAQKTPICFINNKLVGWGQSYYQDHVSLNDTRLK